MRLYLALIVISLHTFTQPLWAIDPRDERLDAEALADIASAYLQDGQYLQADDYYKAAYAKDNTQKEILFQLGQINDELRDYQSAAIFFADFANNQGDQKPLVYYLLAQAQHKNGQYDQAKSNYILFQNAYNGERRSEYMELAKVGIDGCDFAQGQKDAFPSADVQRIESNDINKAFMEYAPRPYFSGQMMYSAVKADSISVEILNNANPYNSRIYVTDEFNGSWTPSTEMRGPINHKKFHVGNPVLSKDQSTMYFTQCRPHKKKPEFKCSIYESKFLANEWQKPKAVFGANSKNFTSTQPAIGEGPQGQEVLYFVSDRDGGAGGLDIWYAIRHTDGEFAFPENLGPEINTKGDDLSPWYDDVSGQLYFSSDGHPGMGGLDIFKSDGNINRFGESINMGAPLNSPADDQYFTTKTNESDFGYLVSNREGSFSQRGATCCDDLYTFELLREEDEKVVVKGYFAKKDDPSQTPIAGIDVSFYKTEGQSFEYAGNITTSDKDMFYFEMDKDAAYKINGTKKGFWPSVSNFNTPNPKRRDTIFQVFLIDEIVQKAVKVKKVYFEFDKASVQDEYVSALDSMVFTLKEIDEASIEVIGHTDSKGPFPYNDKLSVKRAQAAARYLQKQGVAEDQVKIKGQGENKPIAPNVKDDGSDFPEGRAENRRVDFDLDLGPDTDKEVIYEDNKPTKID